jgi:ferredoxin-NADP reductase
VDLLRWHGAEEVEHRSVAFDVFQHVDGRYGRRLRAMTTVFPTLFWLWVRGVKFFIANDPELTPAQRRALEPKIKDWVRAAKADLVPAPKDIFTAVPRYMRRRYHPTQEGSTAKALAYLASSPAARAAAEEAEAATRPLRLVVADRRTPAEGVAELVLNSADGGDLPVWEPGAHLDLLLPSGLVRQYSLCGDPAERGAYRIGVRLTEDSRGGSKEVHAALTAGASVQAHRPRNRFPLGAGAGPRYFVAGGIGITPILSMVRESAARGSDWRLLYVGRSRTSMPFLDEITALAGDAGDRRVTVVETDAEGLPDLAAALDSAPHGATVHVCGPQPLMDAVVATLATLRPGIETRLERFHPADGSAHGDTVEVELRRTGAALTVPADRSVLSAVRDRLPDVAYSCEQGFCGTCKVRVLGGTPEHRDELLTVEERADSMLICVSRSQDGRLVLDL